MPQTSAILDLAIAAALVLFLFLGAKRGFFKMLADLVLVFVATVGARILADLLSSRLAVFLAPRIEESVTARIREELGGLAWDLSGLVPKVLLTQAVEELIHTIAYGILFLAAFLILLTALKIFVGATDLLLRLPVLHQCNQLGGAVLGLALGGLLVWIAVRLCLTFGWWVTEEMVEGSFLLGLLDRLPQGVLLSRAFFGGARRFPIEASSPPRRPLKNDAEKRNGRQRLSRLSPQAETADFSGKDIRTCNLPSVPDVKRMWPWYLSPSWRTAKPSTRACV